VAFIDPRRSAVDIVQAVGRAIRRAEDKTTGTIILPVLIDPDADPEEALSSSAFQPVWDVLRALRAHDDVLAEQFDGLRRELGRNKPPGLHLPPKIHIDFPADIGPGFADACTIRIVEQTTASWESGTACWSGTANCTATQLCPPRTSNPDSPWAAG
jgi:hypothetical protein